MGHKPMTTLKQAERRYFKEQMAAGIRSAEPIAVQRAKERVVRAAMRWAKWSDLRYSNAVDSDLVEGEISRAQIALTRACATLSKQRKQKRRST
jgi:hypothetical protein